MKFVVSVFLLILSTVYGYAAAELGLKGPFIQAGMYVGKVKPGAKVWFNDQPVRVSEEGHYVIGLDWKEKPEIKLRLLEASGRDVTYRLPVQEYQYDVTRINGLPKKMVTPPEEVLARIKKDGQAVREARKADTDYMFFKESFIWPVKGRISGNFGNHRILNGKSKSPHSGMDIAAPTGTPIKAPISGRVTMVDDLYYTGHTVIIDHGYSISTVYCHLHTTNVKVGDMLAQGDLLGTVGSTGRSTGPHLHWGLNWYSERLNPALMLPPK